MFCLAVQKAIGLGWFLPWVIRNDAAVNIHLLVFVWMCPFVSLG